MPRQSPRDSLRPGADLELPQRGPGGPFLFTTGNGGPLFAYPFHSLQAGGPKGGGWPTPQAPEAPLSLRPEPPANKASSASTHPQKLLCSTRSLSELNSRVEQEASGDSTFAAGAPRHPQIQRKEAEMACRLKVRPTFFQAWRKKSWRKDGTTLPLFLSSYPRLVVDYFLIWRFHFQSQAYLLLCNGKRKKSPPFLLESH